MFQTPSSRVTRGHACLFCQQRKVKCDGVRPCSTCLRNGEECTTGHRAKLPNSIKPTLNTVDARLSTRLKRYEEALQAHGIKIDEELPPAESPPPSRHCHLLSNTRLSSPEGQTILKSGDSRYVENSLWRGLMGELQDSNSLPDDADDDEQLSQAAEDWSPNGGMLLFPNSRSGTLRTIHPPVPQIFQLWQIFLNNVNPIVKLFHAPSVQQMVLEAAGDLENLPRSTEALLFAIYLSSVTSMDGETCQRLLHDFKSNLIVRFSKAAEQALVDAEFLKSTNIFTLEALTLYLLATRRLYEPHTLWLLTGIANRIGRAMGLHREDSLRSFSAFEREVRRRLWWQILIMDTRSAQLSGVAVDSSFYLSWDTKRPLNLNDSDLSPAMQELPAEYTGPTEMLFCEIRFEIGDCMRRLKAMENVPADTIHTMRLAEEGRTIDALETRLETGYLGKCDPSIPFHLLAIYLGRSSVCQMRLAVYHPQRYPDKGTKLAQDKKDWLFSLALQIIAYDNLVYSNKRLHPYLWHVAMSFPFEAFILILTELIMRVEGDLVERAWAKVSQVYEDHSELITASKSNALFFALGSLAIRAWDGRLTATRNQNPLYQPVEPPSITKLRALREQSEIQSHPQLTDAFYPTAPLVTGYLTAAEMGNLEETAVENVAPIAMDISHIDWQYWQNLIDEQSGFF